MKINTVRVVSYGKLRDRQFDLVPGLNVFYGPNEAGKSTLRSFITTTLFPKSPLKYPAQKGSDSGSIDIVTEEGKPYCFEKDGKRSSGLGSELCGIDDREYISIYSMSPEDLRDVKGIEKGEIRNRFLTIPGGNDLPRAYAELDAERTKLLPDLRRTSKCEIAMLMEKEHNMSVRVRELQSRECGDNRYASLASERDRLRGELEKTRIKLKEADVLRTAAHRNAGRAADMRRIAELEELESALSYAETVDIEKKTGLDTTLKNRSEELRKAEEELSFISLDLGGRDPQLFLKNRDRIERLAKAEDDYDFYNRQKMVRPAPEPCTPTGLPMVSIAGAITAVAGIAIAAVVNTAGGAAVAVVGLVIAIIGFRRRKNSNGPSKQTVQGRESEDRITALDDQLAEVANNLGIPRRGFHSDIRTLSGYLSKSIDYAEQEKTVKSLKEKKAEAAESLSLFLSGYGGEEGFGKALKDHSALMDVRSQLSALKESTSNVDISDMDPAQADAEYSSAKEEYDTINRELSRTEQALKDIGDDMTVEDAITARSDAGDEVYAACYSWARLMMEKLMLDEATSNAYSNQKPEVLRKADRFLSSMTDGRYRLNPDPRETEISVTDNITGENKTVKECSCGLEDQVKLSIKMAVALSLSKEKPPMILDDILLTSDSVRKKGACGALSMLAKDMQVLYFTCDKETRDFLRMSGAKVHEMD